jgi:hypothetical protein
VWSVVNTNPWITLVGGGSGVGSGPVGYLVAANGSPEERVGHVTVEGATLIITQRATTCTFTAAPGMLGVAAGGGSNVVNVTAGASCAWTATTAEGWLTLSGGSGTGNGSFGVTAAANWSAQGRTGTVSVAGQVVKVTQAGYASGFVFRAIDLSVPGQVGLSLTGGPAGVWEVQVSEDLTNWSALAGITNGTGRVDFVAPAPAGSNRFYRAWRP